jgi:membrane associated rhomboid family serine protease
MYPKINLTPVVKVLLMLNVGFYLLSFTHINLSWMEMYYFESSKFQPFQIITSMFAHGGGGHLFSNMFSLFIFGPMLERLWGSQRFLFFYLFCGVGAGLLYMGVNWYEISQLKAAATAYIQDPNPTGFIGFLNKIYGHFPLEYEEFTRNFQKYPTDAGMISETSSFVKTLVLKSMDTGVLGASGAIFGLLMAFGLLFPNTELFLFLIPVPIKAKYFVTLYGVYELYSGIERSPGDNVAHFAHLGGMLFAYILIRYWSTKKDRFY